MKYKDLYLEEKSKRESLEIEMSRILKDFKLMHEEKIRSYGIRYLLKDVALIFFIVLAMILR